MARNISPVAFLLLPRQRPIHAIGEEKTALVVEHHLDVIKCADWVIDLGPGGDSGGHLVTQRPPEEIADNPNSITGKYLKPLLVPAQ